MKIQFIALFFLVCFFEQAHSYGWSPFSSWDKTFDSVLDAEVPQMLVDMKVQKAEKPLVGAEGDPEIVFDWHAENRI
jgi:hypothetical protein